MSYGLLCSGNNGQVLIDSNNSVLHVVVEGNYSGTPIDAGNHVITVTYPAVITSQLPPVVFVNPDGQGTYIYFSHVGASGNWTGFKVYVGYYSDVGGGLSSSGKYCACIVYPQAKTGYGMQIRDENGRLIFDSNYKIINFMGGAQSWNFSYAIDLTFIFRLYVYSLPWTYGRLGYFMVSALAQAFFYSGVEMAASIGFSDANRSSITAIVGGLPGAVPTMNWPLIAATP